VPLTLEVYGANKLMARLTELRTVRLKQSTEENVRKTCEAIRDDAKAIVPVDTGSLRSSIRLQVRPRPTAHSISYGVSAGGYVTNPKSGKKVNYASFVEYGTRKMAAQPYMRPAIERHKEELPKMFRGRRI
jgi:HK97 gp10 family phage protein